MNEFYYKKYIKYKTKYLNQLKINQLLKKNNYNKLVPIIEEEEEEYNSDTENSNDSKLDINKKYILDNNNFNNIYNKLDYNELDNKLDNKLDYNKLDYKEDNNIEDNNNISNKEDYKENNISNKEDNKEDYNKLDYKEDNNKLDYNLGEWNIPNDLKELYVIGDIHGDYFALIQSLELTGCVNFKDTDLKYVKTEDICKNISADKITWNNSKKNSFIVFAGDTIDRCRINSNNEHCQNTIHDEDCDYNILKLIFELDKKAKEYNSRVIIVLGNHELMNLNNDLRYVSIKGNHENRVADIKQILTNNIDNIFGIIKINKYIIVHGGFNLKYFESLNIKSISEFNKKLRNILLDDNSDINTLLTSDSIFMDRTYGNSEKINICTEVTTFLGIDNFEMVVAHCPQIYYFNKNINFIDCLDVKNSKIHKIDVGMSRAFDSYINFNDDFDKIIDKLIVDIKNNINVDFKILYNINDNEKLNRKVAILQLLPEYNILTGNLSIDYFFEKAFSNDKDRMIYILSDLLNIINNNNKINNITDENYKIYKDKISELIIYIQNKLN
jgi:hypothetical protein